MKYSLQQTWRASPELCTGTRFRQTTRSNNRFRGIMTGDVNAAIRGAYVGGADEVIVTDGHAYGRNVLVEEMDPRARLNSGSVSPLSMVQG